MLVADIAFSSIIFCNAAERTFFLFSRTCYCSRSSTKIIMKILGANWLPKVVGFFGAIIVALADGWQDGTLVLTPKGIAIVVAAIGMVTKQHNVTGIGEKATTDPAKDATQPTNLAGV